MTMTDTTMLYPIGENEMQTRRLITQAQLYDPLTRAFFRAAGIGEGMRVLELGSGVGDVTLLLAEMVGPSGRLLGIELNARAAQTARTRVQAVGWQNAEIVEGVIDSVDLDDEFDAVVGRFVLMWLPDPGAMLQRVLKFLRPGGVVAFQDNDFTFTVHSSPPLPLLDRMTTVLAEMQSQSGPDFHMGLKMHRLYEEAGLAPPQLTLNAPVGTGPDWTGYQYLAETAEMVMPRMRELGMVVPAEVRDTSTLSERIRREAMENQAVIVLPAIVGAWSRKASR